jgi:hypothetical protein
MHFPAGLIAFIRMKPTTNTNLRPKSRGFFFFTFYNAGIT